MLFSTPTSTTPRILGLPAYYVSFNPNGNEVWITSATGPDVAVFNESEKRLKFHVPVGRGPQHVAFAGRNAYVTSGYSGVIESVDAATGRVLARVRSPYGSFELDAGQGYVVAASLLRGTLAIYNAQLGLLHVVHLAPAMREVAISTA